jgi:FkbM family methyltransferase
MRSSLASREVFLSVAAFVLVPVKYGAMIVNRFDQQQVEDGAIGVGFELLQFGEYQAAEAQTLFNVMQLKRRLNGDGVMVVDCGANIGAHTVNWAKAMSFDDRSGGWGEVIAIEPQERVFYALAGNIALNNCWNARAIHAAAGAVPGSWAIPELDHRQPANFGGLNLQKWDETRDEFDLINVDFITIDGLHLPRLDVLKIDVEGMEPDVLDGAATTIRALRPVIYAEHNICGMEEIGRRLPGYVCKWTTANVMCIHEGDPALSWLKV